MRRVLLASVSMIVLLACEPTQAQQSVYCTNCATLAQELAGYARQALQLEQEITIARNAVLNTLSLSGTGYRDLTNQLTQLQSLSNQALMLSGNTRTMLDRLAVTTGYPAGNLAQWQNRFITQDNAISTAMTAAAKVLDQHQSSSRTNSATLAELEAQARGTTGQNATLQTIAGIEATIGQQMQAHHETVNSATKAMLTHYTAQADREAYIRRRVTADMDAGMRGICKNISSIGYPSTLCQTLGASQ